MKSKGIFHKIFAHTRFKRTEIHSGVMNLGIDIDAMTILTAIIAIETLVILVLTIRLLRKSGSAVEKALIVAEKALDKVPTQLNPQEPPAISRDNIENLEKIVLLIEGIKGLFNLDLFIKLGNVEYTQGNLQKALTYYTEVLEQAQSIGDLKRSAICLNNIGLIHAEKGDLDTALEYYEDALEIFGDIGYKLGEAIVYGNIAVVYRRKGDLKKAEKYQEESDKLKDEMG